MYSCLTLAPLILLTAAFQAPNDPIQRYYDDAQALQKAGNAIEAEVRYKMALAEAYARLGKVLLAEGEYDRAFKALGRAVGNGARSEATLIDQATAHFHTRQYEKAIDPLKTALAANPGSSAAHHLLGKVYFMLRQFDKGADELEAALKLAPADFDVAYTLALARLKQKQLPLAQQVFNKLVRRLGSRPEVHNLFGRAYRETNYPDEAIEEFKKTLALNPKYPRAHYNLGLTYLLKDGELKIKEAEKEFRTELAMNPDEFLAIYNLGLVCVVERKHQEAVSLLEKAARLRPKNPDVCLFLGNAYHGAGQFAKAIESLRKSMALNPHLDKISPHAAEAHFLLGQSLVRVGQIEEGEKELEIARELKVKELATDRKRIVAYLNAEENTPHGTEGEERVLSVVNTPDAKMKERFKESETFYSEVVAKIHNQIGLLSADRQDYMAAVDQFRSAVYWDPTIKGVNYNLGLACYKAELYKEAVSLLELEINNDPTNVPVTHLLGMCYFLLEDFAKASTLLGEVPSRSGNVGLYYALSLSLIKQGKVSEASDVIQKMLVMAGDSAQVHVLLGQAYHAQNEDLKALEELRKASEMDSRLPMAHYYSGLIHIKLGKFDEAAREFEAELTLSPKDNQAKYHLSFVLLAVGQITRGMKLMREVIELKPDFADARFELGKALLQLGDVKGAIESLEAAVKLGPEKAHIHYQLGRAYTAAGREADAEKCFETFKQLKDRERNRTNP